MARYDRISALFWVVVALVISEESIRLDPGSLSDPGPGLIPLGCGLIMGIFGLIVFIRSFHGETQAQEVPWRWGGQWRKLLLVIASLIAYALLLDLLGFRIVTLLWMILICRLGDIGWKATFLISVITVIATDIFFGYYLGIRFPRGVLGF